MVSQSDCWSGRQPAELYKDPKDNEREVYNQISPVLAEGQTILK